MIYPEFKKLVEDFDINTKFAIRNKNFEIKEVGDTIGIEWKTGGISGGSCWDTSDDSPHYSTEGNSMPEFSSLDKILENFAPNISFLLYKKIDRELVNHDTRTEYEYYGNCTYYSFKYVNLEKLFNWLKLNNFIK